MIPYFEFPPGPHVVTVCHEAGLPLLLGARAAHVFPLWVSDTDWGLVTALAVHSKALAALPQSQSHTKLRTSAQRGRGGEIKTLHSKTTLRSFIRTFSPSWWDKMALKISYFSPLKDSKCPREWIPIISDAEVASCKYFYPDDAKEGYFLHRLRLMCGLAWATVIDDTDIVSFTSRGQWTQPPCLNCHPVSSSHVTQMVIITPDKEPKECSAVWSSPWRL